jgi:hypothetical protein
MMSTVSLFIFYFTVIFRSCNPTMYHAKVFSALNLARLLEARFEHARAENIAPGGGIFSAARCIRLNRAANDFSNTKLSRDYWRCS